MPRSLDPLPTKVTESAEDAITVSHLQDGNAARRSTRHGQVAGATPSSRTQSPFTDQPFGDTSPLLEPELSVRFERHELLGRGGFGSVYRAYDHKLGRFVAVKVPHRGWGDDVASRRRVEREATATARLRHPHLVTLHDFVTTDEHSLLINELIEGETLAQWLARFPRGCDLRVAAAVVQRIALAVQHAHDQNVLHRDIKPSNILLDTTVVDGELPFCPRLTDFGVARILRDDDATQTQWQFVGTGQYTPPEVLSQDSAGHTRGSDLYSLGVVLYELLAGRRPFAASTQLNLYAKISDGRFSSPRLLRPDIPRDLEAIALRCMARSPGQRYASAADLAADLTRFLNGDPVVARLPATTERLLRWMRRYPTQAAVVSISATAVLMVVIAVAVMNRKLSRVNADLQVSNQQKASALQAGRQMLEDYEQTIYAGDMFQATTAIQERRLRDGRALLTTYADGQPLAHHRDVEWEHARFQIFRDSKILWKSDQALYSIALSNDKLAVGGAASQVALLNRVSGDVIYQWETEQTEVNSIVLGPDTNKMWCSGDDGTVHAYDTGTGKPIYQIRPFQEGRAYDLFHFPKLQRLICFSSQGTIAAFDQSTGEILHRWPAPKEGALSVAPVDSGQFVVGHFDGLLRFYDVVSAAVQQELKLEDQPAVRALKLDPATHRLWILAGSSVRLLDLQTAVFTSKLATTDETLGIAYDSMSASYVVSMAGGVFQRVRVTADAAIEPVDQWVNEGQRIFAIEADPESGEILSADAEGMLRKWHPAALDRTEYPGPAKSKSLQFDFIPDSDIEDWPQLVSINRKQVFSLPARTGQRETITYQGPLPVSVSAVGKHQLLIGSNQSPAQLLDLASGTTSDIPVHGSGPVNRSVDGRWLCGVELLLHYAWLLDTTKSAAPERLPAHHAHAITVATEHGRVFWNDGNALMSRLIASADAPQQHANFSRIPKFLELSHDQRLIAIGLSDREVHLWDWQHDRRVGPVLMHHGELHAMAFSAGGRTLMTLDQAAVLRFWNVRTGKLVLEQQVHTGLPGNITQARFSPDGRFLVILYNRQHFATLRLY